MKNIAILALAALLFVACKKEETDYYADYRYSVKLKTDIPSMLVLVVKPSGIDTFSIDTNGLEYKFKALNSNDKIYLAATKKTLSAGWLSCEWLLDGNSVQTQTLNLPTDQQTAVFSFTPKN